MKYLIWTIIFLSFALTAYADQKPTPLSQNDVIISKDELKHIEEALQEILIQKQQAQEDYKELHDCVANSPEDSAVHCLNSI